MIKRILSAAAVLLIFIAPALAWDINTMAGESPWIFTPLGEKVLKVNPSGDLNVSPQDQSTPPLFIKANNVVGATTLAAATAINDTSITVASDAAATVGNYIGVFSTVTNRFYVATILTKPGGNVLTLDTPLDSVFSIGDTVGFGITDMSVNGSVTPVVFSIRGQDPGINVTAHITRIIITCTDGDPVDFTKFCGGPILTNGIVMRRVDGFTQNIINWKSNFEIAGSMYDWTVLATGLGQQGIDGFISRLTFGGPSKIGVVLEIGPGEEIEFIVQDDLTGITKLEIMVEGHVVE